ncbi:protein DOG1-like 4 [Telopea speciosissima]|uniref:protein DOG1-like 4 n=1 Tax=Telopea speciosissima TaxID=54955 RepID=UPI001CC38026|nr:protein DOG1-like 4 [Telopea speciosissima]
MRGQVQDKFSEFYEQWVNQHEVNLKELLSVPRDPSSSSNEQLHRALVSKVVIHYKQYYTVKWASAKDDVLGFFSPTWFSSLENAYHWITGWKPSMLFRLITSLRQTRVPGANLVDMTEEQLEKIQELLIQIRIEEDRVDREMERQQVSIADKPMVDLSRLATQVNNGEVVGELDKYVDVTLSSLLAGLENVMKMADCVRLMALKGVLEVLNPLQSVDFLAAIAMLQIQLRVVGKRRDHAKMMTLNQKD